MIRATTPPDGRAPLVFEATVNGLPVYLDNFAIIELSKEGELQDRFIASLDAGADLMFSTVNAVELVGPQGGSSDRVRRFLDRVEAHWFPVGIGTGGILAAEAVGRESGCVSGEFVKAFFDDRTAGIGPGSGKLIVLNSEFFRLGSVLDWLAPQRENVRVDAAAFDAVLIPGIEKARSECDADPTLLDRAFPVTQFAPAKPATFVQINLTRQLIEEAKGYRLKKGDGADFHHVLMGVAFSSFAVVDKHWKRRLGQPSASDEIIPIAWLHWGHQMTKCRTCGRIWPSEETSS
jgi:hypothetical protein